jgi:ABC-type branched-subunit amino acid transport system substrate-binding protein
MKKTIQLCFVTIFFILFGIQVCWAKPPIKIGSPLPMTGPYVADGDSYWKGQKMFVEDINKQGGILGRQLELVRFDTQEFAPETVKAAADSLIGNKKVDVIMAGWAGWGQDVRAYGKYKVPTFVWNASQSSIEVFRQNPKKYSNWFMMLGPEKEWGNAYFNLIKGLPVKFSNNKVAIITSDDAWGLGIAEGIEANAIRYGWEVSMKEVVPYGTREWGPILTKIRRLKPAYIQLEIMGLAECKTFLSQFKKSPTNSILHFGYETAVPDFALNLGNEANGIIGTGMPLMIPQKVNSQSKAWLMRYKEKFGQDPVGGSYSNYIALMWWKKAVEAVGNVTDYKKIVNYIADKSFTEMSGATLKFNDDHYISNKLVGNPHLQVQNGKLAIINQESDAHQNAPKFIKPDWMK